MKTETKIIPATKGVPMLMPGYSERLLVKRVSRIKEYLAARTVRLLPTPRKSRFTISSQ